MARSNNITALCFVPQETFMFLNNKGVRSISAEEAKASPACKLQCIIHLHNWWAARFARRT